MKRWKYLVLCSSLLTNVVFGILTWNCYRERSPEEQTLLEKLGLTCVCRRHEMMLYERNRDGAMFDVFAVLSDTWLKQTNIFLYTFPLPEGNDGLSSMHRSRVVCSCGGLLFVSYVIDESGSKSSMLVQTKDSQLLYFPSLDGAAVAFPRVELEKVQDQMKVLRITDEIQGARNDG